MPFDSLRTVISRCSAIFRRKQLDASLDEELRSHIEHAIEEHLASGMSYSQARTAALRSFGGVTQTREAYRQRRGLPLLDEVVRDTRFGLRQLYRSPGFAFTAIITLALGLGANTAIFSLINSLLLRPLPVPHAEELSVLNYSRTDSQQPGYYFNAPLIRSLEKHHDGFSSIAAFSGTTMQVRSGSANQQVPGALVSGQFFAVLETPPLLGRYLTPQDDQAGSPNGYAVVISESFWNSWFNRAPDVVGRKLTIANTPFIVVGVMPSQFIGANPTSRPSLYVPLAVEPVIDAPYNNIESGFSSWWLEMIARRAPGVSQQQASAAVRAISNTVLAEAAPKGDVLDNERKNHFQLGAQEGSRGYNFLGDQFRKPLTVVFSLCACVLLLACLNLASLLTARAAGRERELATRLAIGASRRRLIQQLLVESLLIALLGTAAGLAVSPAVSRFLAGLLIGTSTDTVLDTSLDLRVFAFTALIAVVAALLIGLLPALRATSGELNNQMKNGGLARSTRDGRRWLPRILMGTEVALSLILVVGAGLLASSLTRLYRTGLGFEPKGLVNFDLVMDKQSLEGDALLHWYQAYAGTLAQLPGVKSVSYDSITPLSGSIQKNTYRSGLNKSGHSLYGNTVGPEYFATMRIPMVAGRDFQWNDTKTSPGKIILNQSAARAMFPGVNPIGQTVLGYKDHNFEVIGVVADVHYTSVRDAAPPTAYRPITQDGFAKGSYTAIARVEGPVVPFAEAMRSLTTRMAPEIPTPNLTTMSSQLDDSIAAERMMAILSVFFAACALLVTAIGLYGTLAYSTARRTSEIGIRIALGAQRLQVVLLVFRENAWVAAGGSVAGLVAALLASKALASFLYGTSTRDPWVLAASCAALVLIASAASLLPAVRAARIDPMQALRSE
jgi:predicted permease